MADQWKDYESFAASLFGVHRAWANSGERLDFPQPQELMDSPAVGQCKNVRVMSLNTLTYLAEEIEREGLRSTNREQQKLGVVCAKVRRGRGRSSSSLVVMTDTMWAWLLKHPGVLGIIQTRREKEGLEPDGNG